MSERIAYIIEYTKLKRRNRRAKESNMMIISLVIDLKSIE